MRSAVRAVFFLAMILLGLGAAELHPADRHLPNAQHSATVGQAQHRRLRGRDCRDGRGRGRGRGGGRGRGRGNRDGDNSPPPRVGPRSPTPPGMQTLLELHNKARCLHSADPLTYSEEAAALAKAHAQLLANSCGETDHSESEDINGYGQNLFVCASTEIETCYTPEAAMASLYDDETQAESVAEYGEHATQILWKSTTELGCAVATCDKDAWAYVYLVCQYNPAADHMDLLEEEVGLPSGDSC